MTLIPEKSLEYPIEKCLPSKRVIFDVFLSLSKNMRFSKKPSGSKLLSCRWAMVSTVGGASENMVSRVLLASAARVHLDYFRSRNVWIPTT